MSIKIKCESNMDRLTPALKMFYLDLIVAYEKVKLTGADPNDAVSIVTALLVKSAREMGMENLADLPSGVKLAVEFKRGLMEKAK